MVSRIDPALGKRAKNPLPPAEIVYMTAVLSRLNDPLYEEALRKVRERHPYAALLSAKTLWANREGWLASHEAVLAPVTQVYIMPEHDGSIGQGLALELIHFHKRNPAPKVCGIFGKKLKFEATLGLDISTNPTATRFARLLPKTSAMAKPKAKRTSKKVKPRRPEKT